MTATLGFHVDVIKKPFDVLEFLADDAMNAIWAPTANDEGEVNETTPTVLSFEPAVITKEKALLHVDQYQNPMIVSKSPWYEEKFAI